MCVCVCVDGQDEFIVLLKTESVNLLTLRTLVYCQAMIDSFSAGPHMSTQHAFCQTQACDDSIEFFLLIFYLEVLIIGSYN